MIFVTKHEILQIHKPWRQDGFDCYVPLKVFQFTATHELDYQFHVEYNQTAQQTDEFQRSGSGWILYHLQDLDLCTCLL